MHCCAEGLTGTSVPFIFLVNCWNLCKQVHVHVYMYMYVTCDVSSHTSHIHTSHPHSLMATIVVRWRTLVSASRRPWWHAPLSAHRSTWHRNSSEVLTTTLSTSTPLASSSGTFVPMTRNCQVRTKWQLFVWQSRVEIEGCSVVYFEHIATFKALCPQNFHIRTRLMHVKSTLGTDG